MKTPILTLTKRYGCFNGCMIESISLDFHPKTLNFMLKIIEYTIAAGDTWDALVDAVVKNMKQGWQRLGGVNQGDGGRFWQALVKYAN